ncbi:MAG TPA: hypothetical protein VFF51_01240 [Candidatus Methylomirabilis sp.]|nr:hypothetical protein [Candidatus Methylomirabilis sp.]
MRPLVMLVLVAVITAGCAAPKAPVASRPAAPQKPPPQKPPPVKPEPPPPSPPVLSSDLSQEEEWRFQREADAKIEGVERRYRRIDERKVAPDQREILLTIRSFLAKAREAVAVKDFSRAFNLAEKAHALVEELSRSIR